MSLPVPGGLSYDDTKLCYYRTADSTRECQVVSCTSNAIAETCCTTLPPMACNIHLPPSPSPSPSPKITRPPPDELSNTPLIVGVVLGVSTVLVILGAHYGYKKLYRDRFFSR